LPKSQEDEIIDIAIRLRVESWYIGWWYWSDEGWREFEKLWADLPEVINNPLWISRQVVPTLSTIDRCVIHSMRVAFP
jgi:hypothetical protein